MIPMPLMQDRGPQRLPEHAGLLEVPRVNAVVAMLRGVAPSVVVVVMPPRRTLRLQEARGVERGRAALHEGGEHRALESFRRGGEPVLDVRTHLSLLAHRVQACLAQVLQRLERSLTALLRPANVCTPCLAACLLGLRASLRRELAQLPLERYLAGFELLDPVADLRDLDLVVLPELLLLGHDLVEALLLVGALLGLRLQLQESGRRRPRLRDERRRQLTERRQAAGLRQRQLLRRRDGLLQLALGLLERLVLLLVLLARRRLGLALAVELTLHLVDLEVFLRDGLLQASSLDVDSSLADVMT